MFTSSSFKKMSIKKTFTILTSILLLLVIAVIVVVSQLNESIRIKSEGIEHNELSVLNKAHESKLAVVQVQQWLTDISATRARDGLNDGFDEAAANAEKFKQLIAELSALDTERAGFYKKMIPVFDAYYETGKRMAQAYIDGGPEQGNKMMLQFDEVAASMTDEINQLVLQTNQHVIEVFEEEIAQVKIGQKIFVTGMLIILVGIIICYLVLIKVINYLPVAIKEIQKVADGDLTSGLV